MKNILILGTILILTSCANNKKEFPAPDTITPAPVFTGPTITYNNHTKRLFDDYCIACHAVALSQSCCPLETYNQVDNYTSPSASKGDQLQTRVLDFGTMPPSGSVSGFLTPAEKDTLQWWLDQGAPQ